MAENGQKNKSISLWTKSYLLFGGVYYTVQALFFLFGLYYVDFISTTLTKYSSITFSSSTAVIVLSLAGFLLNGLAATGAFLMFRALRPGYYIFMVSAIIMFFTHLIFIETDWIFLGINVVFIFFISTAFRHLN